MITKDFFDSFPKYGWGYPAVTRTDADTVSASLEKTQLGREVRISGAGDLYIKGHKALFTSVASRAMRRLRAVDWWSDRFSQLVPGSRPGPGRPDVVRTVVACRKAVERQAFNAGEDGVLTLRGVHLLAVVQRVVSQGKRLVPPLTSAQACEAIDAVFLQGRRQGLFPFGDTPPACAEDQRSDPDRDALAAVQGVIDVTLRTYLPAPHAPATPAEAGGRARRIMPRDPVQPACGSLSAHKRGQPLLSPSASATPSTSQSLIVDLPGQVPGD